MNGSTFLDTFLLGVLQGVTEFLPISSSGHLVIAQGYFTHLSGNAMIFDVMLHFGTLLAVVFYFWREVRGFLYLLVGKEVQDSPIPVRRWFWLIIVATIPSGIIGLTLEKPIEALFSSPTFAAGAIFVNGILLLTTSMAPQLSRQAGDLGVRDAILIGLMQGFAILPGISRSSNTIATGLFLGIKGDVAARFSFLMSIPAILGAVLVKSRGLHGADMAALIPYGVGAVVSLVTGLWAIAFLLRVIMKGKFQFFGYYCLLFGGGMFLLLQ
ncbi:MAG: undecaprenyl-diphosphate phosphatase [Candidatus Binatia bacterium]